MESAHKNREYRVSVVGPQGDSCATRKAESLKRAILDSLAEVTDEWLLRSLGGGPVFELTLVIRRDP